MKAHTPRTLLIAPWFGPWPNWIEVFLIACKYNPNIDWLILGDHALPGGTPANVRLEQTRFEVYRERCGAVLGLSLAWTQPYKLCDLRPAYGLIHRADLTGYELWGWTDLDVVYGDLGPFIARRSPGHGVVSFSGTHLSGEFCLFRNHPAVNHAFEFINDWERLMCDESNHALDEVALAWVFAPPQMEHVMFSQNQRTERGRLVDIPNADALQQAHPASFENSYTTPSGIGAWHDGTHRHPLVWHWKAGVLSNKTHPRHSYPYLNLLNFKSDYYWLCTLSAYGYAGDGARPLWDQPAGRLNDSIHDLEHCGFVIDRRGFSAMPRGAEEK